MKVSIPYGSTKIDVDIPEKNIQNVIYPNYVDTGDAEDILAESLNNPVGMERFNRWVEKQEDILFVVNDATRPTPTSKILNILGNWMDLKEAKFIIATGTHRNPDKEELKFIFGDLYGDIKDRILFHDSEDYSSMKYMGKTGAGTEVWVNDNILKAGAIIPIGSVEPHYMGGFTGGRKFFVPGLAGFKTCEQNHKLALKSEAEVLKLEGNPVHEDFIDAINMISEKPIFSVQTVINKNEELYAATCGDIHESFNKATEYAMDIFCVPVKGKSDIVVSVATPPMDRNLYQSHKTIEHCKLALHGGGILILIAECREGIGPDLFYDFLKTAETAEGVINNVRENYRLGYHKSARIAELSKISEIWAVTEIEDKIIKEAFMEPFSDIQDSIDRAIEKKGKESSVLIFNQGALTIPVVKG